MDYGEILHTATQKDQGKKQIQYYSTKFTAPKKEQRSKTPSVNVQKFLARKEAEERKKFEEAKQRREKLLELRSHDKKATRRVNVMLKRTKSANQAVIEEAHDEDNTAVTLAGPSQPDEDDYGYVSKESEAYYNKMMEKYSKMPEEPKFGTERRKISTNLESTRAQMKAALDRDQEEANTPHRRKRKRTEQEGTSEKAVNSPVYEEEKKPQVQKPKFKPAPLVNFEDLLKLAEKKQHEPIVIEPKKVEVERPLTKRQKREIDAERLYFQQRQERLESQARAAEGKPSAPGKIRKLSNNGQSSQPNLKIPKKPTADTKVPPKPITKPAMPSKTVDRNANTKPEVKKSPVASPAQKFNGGDRVFKKPEVPSSREAIAKKPDGKLGVTANGRPPVVNGKPKEFPPRDLVKKRPDDGRPRVLNGKPKEFPPRDVKPKQFPPADLKPKQFPPADVRRKEFPPRELKKKPMLNNKRRIIDDDDDEDYDSEMDDFIDDGPEGEEDYSSAIRDIFGYDKRKYRYVDDEEADNMESSFAQQMREECISTKLGIKEDLEDMRMEEEHKKLKAKLKKKGCR